MEAPVRVGLHADLALAHLFLHSDLRPPTHYPLPGLGLSATVEIPITEWFLISTGWA